jgi:hypothetical protein
MNVSLPQMLSRPCRVLFDGWETTTAKLQSCGWRLAAEQQFYDGRMRLAMHHDASGLYMVSEVVEYDFMRMDPRSVHANFGTPTFVVRQVVGREVNFHVTELPTFMAIDARPQFVERQVRRIEDLGFFATPLVETEELIVEPATVQGLLDQIRTLQSPELAAIRARNKRREGEEARNFTGRKYHAQIVSLAA